MNKKKIAMISGIVVMVTSLILVIHDLVSSSGHKLMNILSHSGLFLFGVYLHYLNVKRHSL